MKLQKAFRIGTLIFIMAATTIVGVNCGLLNSNKSDTSAPGPAGGGGPTPTPQPGTYSMSQIGAPGGWFPAFAYSPTVAGTIWASGDDGAGLFKSTDGGVTWAGVPTGFINQSTYSLRFDPTNPNKIYAPNHFGRGMMKSVDGGATWTLSQAGLPIVGNNNQLLYDLAINPTNTNIMFAATDLGLYKSTDGGNNFTLNTTTLAGSVAVHAVAFRSDGVLFIGKADGAFGYTANNGGTFSQLLPPTSPNPTSINFIIFSSSSLYLGYKNAGIYRLDKMTFAGGLINDPSVAGSIQNSNRIVAAVYSGASAATDILYVGTSGASTFTTAQWGLFKSTNGGNTWAQKMNGMAGNYVMSVAINPNNSNNVIVGSTNGRGSYHSTDGGNTWIQSTNGLMSTTSLGFAQDTLVPKHLVISSTAGGGFSLNFETFNGGTTWTSFSDPVVDDGVFGFDIDPKNSLNILAGTYTKGIYRSTNGTAGPWTSVVSFPTYLDRFVRDTITPTTIYAVAPSGDSNHSLYVSTNNGVSFTPRSSFSAWSVTPHPLNANEAVAPKASDVMATSNAFSTSVSLGLSGFAPAAAEGGFDAAAFNPANPSELIVGGASGGIYRTLNYNVTGVGVTWTKLSTPIVAAPIRDVLIINRNGNKIYYANTAGGQSDFTTNSTPPGVYRSFDGGTTWTTLSGSLFPGTLTWRLYPDVAAPTSSFFVGMWAPGLYQLLDTQ